MNKFIIHTEYGELLDLAMHLQDEGNEVLLCIPNKDYTKIGEGIVPKLTSWWEKIGQGYIWCIDGCAHGNMQDWLRSKGEAVFGGCEHGDKLENDRQMGQKLFKAAGFYQPMSKNFKSLDDALKFVTSNRDKRWIIKQNGDAPKSLNHMGKFEDNSDMIFHIQTLKKRWNESEYGKVDFDLMEVVTGLEVAASAFFNGQDYMRNKDGKVVGFLNFEEKKEANGATGETTGEMGTTFVGTNEDNVLFREMIMKPKIIETLKAINFRGVFDINCIKTDKGIVALEPTCRFGVPSTSYEFLEAMENVGETIKMIAEGKSAPISIAQGVGMVMCVVAKPYPVEVDVDDEATSQGEKLWILKDKKPVKDFTEEQKKRIHLYNFFKDEDYFVATKNGYLLTVTGKGKTISEVRNNLIEYIKDNLYISGMKYRTDIGKRVEEYYGSSEDQKLLKKHQEEIDSLKKKHESELSNIKQAIRKAVYE